MKPDPNKDRNDTIVPEYWSLGEDFQDKIRLSGYESETVEGVAVDIHDLLQAADAIRIALASEVDLRTQIDTLLFELDHIKWHCDAATRHLEAAKRGLPQR